MSFATIATIALVASTSFVSAAPVAARDEKPSTYYEGYLEEYDIYHARYIALDCKTKHDTTFFDDCCHPLLANETLADARLSYCSPDATVTSSIASTIAEYTATAVNASAAATATADIEAESAYSSASTSVEEAASTASYAWVTESASASASASATESASASASATLEAVADYAWKSSSTKKHHKQTSTSSSAEPEWTAPSTTASPPASTPPASSGGDVKTGGFATFFYQAGNAGECGKIHSDNDYVIAIDSNGWWSDYQSNWNSPHCGKSITLTNTNNGKSVTAVVADVCPTCVSDNSLDLSVAAFNAIAEPSDGSVPITWVWA